MMSGPMMVVRIVSAHPMSIVAVLSERKERRHHQWLHRRRHQYDNLIMLLSIGEECEHEENYEHHYLPGTGWRDLKVPDF